MRRSRATRRGGRLLSLVLLPGLPLVTALPAPADGPCEPSWDLTIGNPGLTGSYVRAIAAYDDGSGAGPRLHVGGFFAPGNVARWDGLGWEQVGTGLDGPSAVMIEYGGALLVGGAFESAGGVAGSAKLAQWDGSEWAAIGAQLSGASSSVWALEVFDDDGAGDDVYVGGSYLNIGATNHDYIARWDGTTFTEVGGTLGGTVVLVVLDLKAYDDGGGEALYAVGRFETIGGVPASHIARWDGSEWSSLGAGIDGLQVLAIEVYDDGGGPALYAGGSFTAAGGAAASNIARWDGSAWSAVGDGLDFTVQDLAVYDDGSGPELYAVGSFMHAGTLPVSRIARWDATQWSPVGAGLDNTGFGAYAYDDGQRETLVVGGSFTRADGQLSNLVARFVGCPRRRADINGDGVVNVLDLLVLLSAWGPCPGCPADVNEDGVVNAIDLLDVLADWG